MGTPHWRCKTKAPAGGSQQNKTHAILQKEGLPGSLLNSSIVTSAT